MQKIDIARIKAAEAASGIYRKSPSSIKKLRKPYMKGIPFLENATLLTVRVRTAAAVISHKPRGHGRPRSVVADTAVSILKEFAK